MQHPTESTLKTSFGKFRITTSPNYITSLKPESFLYSIGGKNKCVQIKVTNSDEPIAGDLVVLETERGGCELKNITIKSELTHKIVSLLITYIKQQHPKLIKIELLDDSKLHCLLPDERKVAYSMMFHNIAFHQKTYYQRIYGAELLDGDERSVYETLILNINDPSKKPKKFSFNNPSLVEHLQPLWDATASWKDFFSEIEKKFGDKKCMYIYPWIKPAIFNIFENKTIGQKWVIHTENLPQIEYEEVTDGGSRRRTHKNKRYNEIDDTITDLSYDEIYNIKY